MLSPFAWYEDPRLGLRVRFDALHTHLYGGTAHDDIRYVYSTVPIVRGNEETEWSRFPSRDFWLAW